jgi:hypothetical protein
MNNDDEGSHNLADNSKPPVVPQNFTWAPGQRKDSQMLIYKGRMFMKNKERGSKTYYSCRKKRANKLTKSFCLAAGHVDEEGMFHYNQKPHL